MGPDPSDVTTKKFVLDDPKTESVATFQASCTGTWRASQGQRCGHSLRARRLVPTHQRHQDRSAQLERCLHRYLNNCNGNLRCGGC